MLYKSSIKTLTILGWITAAACLPALLAGGTALAGGGTTIDPSHSNPGDPILDPAEPTPPYVPNQLVIDVPDGVDPYDLIQLDFGGQIIGSLEHSSVYLCEMPAGFDAEAGAAGFDSMSVVGWAQPNYVLNRLHPVQGSYPFSDEQQIGSYENQYAALLLDLAGSHSQATGNGVTIGLVDGGVDASYDVLADVIIPGYDYIQQDGDPFDEPGGLASGHGTFVAGVLHLVAPEAMIRPYRIFDPSGDGDGFTLAQAIERAVDDGCDVINISVVLAHEHLAVKQAIDYAESQGVTVVVAAGNESTTVPVYPAWYDNVIAVAAVDSSMLLTGFSNYGPQIDVCTPGYGIYSTYQDTYYAWWSGSSFAAPFVAGQAALLKEVSPAADGDLIRLAIVASADNIDDVNPGVSGMLGGGLADPLASIAEINNSDSAWLAPDTLYFETWEGMIFFTAPTEMTLLYSTNAPADYTAERVLEGEQFSWLLDSVGVTDDSVIVQMDASTLPVGTYYNTYLFHVDGVLQPAELTVCAVVQPPDTSVTALATPSYLLYQAYSTEDPPITQWVYLQSTNAPASYTGQVLPGGDQFVSLYNPSGVTNDSLRIDANPGWMPGPGFYVDTVVYTVAGAADPVVIPVYMEITDTINVDSCWVYPAYQAFYADEGVDSVQFGMVFVASSNAPANYNVSVVGTADFVSLMYSSGQTDDSLVFQVTSDSSMAAGIYVDTLEISVDGCHNSPRRAVFYLQVGDVGPSSDTCWVYPFAQAHFAPEGVNYQQYGSILVGSDNPPKAFSVSVVGSADFVSLPEPTGFTTDSVAFLITSDSSMPAGVYADTLRIDVDSVGNSPKYAIVYLQIGDVGPTGDTCWVYPGYQAFYAPGGVDYLQYGSVFVGSNNAPQPFSVRVLDYPDFTVLPTTEGTTGDTLLFEVVSRNFTNPGIYTDTLEITVDSVDNSPKLAVLYLQVYEPNTDSLWLIPSVLNFSAPEGSSTVQYGYSMLWSKYDPQTYHAFIDTTQSWLSLVSSTGLTKDTVGVMVDPSGLAPGDYSEIVWFIAENISDDAFLRVNLTVGGGQTEPDSVALTPDTLVFYADEGSEMAQSGTSWLSSINAPANYTAVKDTSSFFLTLLDTAGVTDDSVAVMVDPSGLSAGTYLGTAWYFVDGVGMPGQLTVFLVIDSVATPPSDSVWVLPDSYFLQATYGSSTPIVDTAILFSSNWPATWCGFVLGGPGSFVQIVDTIGETNDSVIVVVDPTGLSPGYHGDTVVLYVDGISGSVILPVILNITTTDSVSAVQNFPNPFNPETEIHFSLPVAGRVSLSVYNITGQLVATLVDGPLEAGNHAVNFNGSAFASGVYFYRLQTEQATLTRKMILLK